MNEQDNCLVHVEGLGWVSEYGFQWTRSWMRKQMM